jgi:hypothetical protein
MTTLVQINCSVTLVCIGGIHDISKIAGLISKFMNLRILVGNKP